MKVTFCVLEGITFWDGFGEAWEAQIWELEETAFDEAQLTT